MPKPKTATSPMVIHHRRRIVNAANILSRLTKDAPKIKGVPLVVHDLLLEATKLVVRAYKELPDQ